ncbi:hypothetical protein L345_16315, partial [Ophiophagus hannah]
MAVVEVEVVGAQLEPGADEVSCRRESCAGVGRRRPEGESRRKAGPLSPTALQGGPLADPGLPLSWVEPPAPGTVYLSQQTSDWGTLGKGLWASLERVAPLMAAPNQDLLRSCGREFYGPRDEAPKAFPSQQSCPNPDFIGSCGREFHSPFQGMILPRRAGLRLPDSPASKAAPILKLAGEFWEWKSSPLQAVKA